MTKNALKKKIKKKFSSLSNFGRCAGIDRNKLQIFFARDTKPKPEEFELIEKAYREIEARETGNVIDKYKLATLVEQIEIYGGVYKFCKDNPKFPMDQVYELVNGKRKRHSKLVQSLFDHFKIG